MNAFDPPARKMAVVNRAIVRLRSARFGFFVFAFPSALVVVVVVVVAVDAVAAAVFFGVEGGGNVTSIRAAAGSVFVFADASSSSSSAFAFVGGAAARREPRESTRGGFASPSRAASTSDADGILRGRFP